MQSFDALIAWADAIRWKHMHAPLTPVNSQDMGSGWDEGSQIAR